MLRPSLPAVSKAARGRGSRTGRPASRSGRDNAPESKDGPTAGWWFMRFEGALGRLNESYFFREFTFSTNTFRPDKRTELELADAVVWLDEFLIVVQVKERYAAFGATSTDEENWFNREVLGKAVTQIGNTLQYLHSYDSIGLANNQGHTFNLADAKDKRT